MLLKRYLGTVSAAGDERPETGGRERPGTGGRRSATTS